MSNELKAVNNNLADATIYALIANRAGQFWNGTTFETYATANRSTYDIPMTEQGTSSGIYYADFPTAVTTAGSYDYYVYNQDGASPAEADGLVNIGKVDWTGVVSVTGPGAMVGSDWRSYVLRGGFRRTDKDTELYEATTDAIEELRRRYGFDEAQVDTQMTDQVTTLGDFRLDVESDFGLIINVIIEDDDTADVLTQVSKSEFDCLYPDIHATTDRGYPKHYTIFDGQIYLGPIPDQTDYVYRKSYSARGGTVTSSTTTAVPFTNYYRDVLRDLVLSKLWEIMDQYERATYFKQKFEEGFVYITRRENLNQGRNYFVVRPTY